MIKKLLYGLLILLLGMAALGYYLYQKKPADAASQQPAFSMSAMELLEAFQLDEAAANARYLGKWLELRGAINLMNADAGMIYLGEPAAGASVSCLLDSTQQTLLTTLQPGDSVSIKGFCSGYLMDVQITSAQVLP